MIDKVGAMQSEELSYACWMCRGEAMPNNVQRFALCHAHLYGRIFSLMGLTPRGKKRRRGPDSAYESVDTFSLSTYTQSHNAETLVERVIAGEVFSTPTLVDELYADKHGA